MRRLFFFALLLFFALGALAQPVMPIDSVPARPRTGDPVDLRVWGYCMFNVQAARNGFSIIVTADVGMCDPPIAHQVTVPLGPLPPGTYHASYTDDSGQLVSRGTFTVEKRTDAPFTVHPFAVPSTALAPIELRLQTTSDTALCPVLDQCIVRVGGVVVPKRRSPYGGIIVGAPALAPGYADVEIAQQGQTLEHIGAVYYYALDAVPDFALWERVLFPVLFNAPGANGSDWRSEAVIANARPWTVEMLNGILPGQCIDYPCGERLAPLEKMEIDGGNYRNGVALLVPRDDAGQLAFALRIRDVSRAAEGFGTEIPVLRESQMIHDAPLTMLDVPLESRYRVKVRVYAFDENSARGTLVTHDRTNDARTRTDFFLRKTCNSLVACAAAPSYAEIDLPSAAGGTRVNLYVEMPAGVRGWAFATVTNNTTQQVTIVTADGTGGEPCPTCTTP
ncbi:MAG TPA: hypothetical protein VHK90_01480 [Thermoanaerobaculia bacterium]|nr:hypothetical protein [Thermoanaerobaculia bacterium]